jgi:6-phosphogluconolactonase
MRFDNGMKLSRRTFLAAPAAAAAARAAERELTLYVGAYTSPKNPGITVMKFDLSTGELKGMTLAAETQNPTFLAIHPTGRWLYAINEIGNYEGQRAGSVSAFAIDSATGKLTALNRVSSKGPGPCHISIDRSGKAALIANYGGGSVASYRISSDGRLSEAVSFHQHEGKGPNARRQEGPHAHSINVSPDNRYAIVADLGTDELKVYRLDAETATLTPQEQRGYKPAAGSGPRHFTFHPNGKWAYVNGELDSTVTALEWDARNGVFKPINTQSTLPADFTGSNTTAEVRVHPNGRTVYVSNRGHESIAAFRVRPDGGVEPLQHISVQGQMPRNFVLDPAGRWLLAANQRSDNIVVMRVDAASGKLEYSGKGIIVGAPVCLRFLPRG